MSIRKKSLYFFVILSSVAAYIWIGWNEKYYNSADANTGLDVCLFKRLTGFPCPSCGSTRAVLYISRLRFNDAFLANPLGFLIAFGLLVFPAWVLYDLLNGKSSFYKFYSTAEFLVRRRWVAIPLIVLIAANWLWSINKFVS